MTTAFGLAAIVGGVPQIASAGGAPPSPEELERIKVGYKRISYLLANFEQETTSESVCAKMKGLCGKYSLYFFLHNVLRSLTQQ